MAFHYKIVVKKVDWNKRVASIQHFLEELSRFDIGELTYCYWTKQLIINFYEHDDEYGMYHFLQRWFKDHSINYNGLEKYK